MGNLINIPIQYTVNGLHRGHTALAAYAVQYGNPEFMVTQNYREITDYYLKGRPIPSLPQAMPKLGKDISNLKMKLRIMNHQTLPEEGREMLLKRVRDFAAPFIDKLILPQYKDELIARLMGNLNIVEFKDKRMPETVYANAHPMIIHGPEPVFFMMNKLLPLLGLPDRIIMPTIIKHPEFKIKQQSALENLHPIAAERIKRFQYVVGGARKHYKLGDNADLVRDLNSTYRHRGWKIEHIVVFEGGWVPGRLEITQFAVMGPVEYRWVTEVDYIC